MCGGVGGRRPTASSIGYFCVCRVMSFVDMSIAMAALLLEDYDGIPCIHDIEYICGAM